MVAETGELRIQGLSGLQNDAVEREGGREREEGEEEAQ